MEPEPFRQDFAKDQMGDVFYAQLSIGLGKEILGGNGSAPDAVKVGLEVRILDLAESNGARPVSSSKQTFLFDARAYYTGRPCRSLFHP